MELKTLHSWDVTPSEAVALQKSLAEQANFDQPLAIDSVRYVAGVDVSVKNNVSQAAVVVLTFPALELVETVTASMPTPFPYVPGLLSFREGPVLVDAFAKLNHTPDAFIFDGMGRIHTRQMGIATQMGLWLQKPTLGCGKTHFIGDYADPGPEKGDHSELRYKGQQLGVVLRTRAKVKPVYISVGHLMDLPSAIALTMACTTKYRLPRPIRLAHSAAGEL